MSDAPELLVTPHSVQAVSTLLDAGADAVVVGEEQFGLRLAGEFSRDDVKKAIDIAHEKGKKAYVSMNGIFHNEHIDGIYDYLHFLQQREPDAILFGDPAVLMAAREVAPAIPLHWNPETIATNWYTANYWGRKGAKRAVMARELSLEALIETKVHANVEIEIQIHGATCMFQSKRKLVENYMAFQGKNLRVENRSKDRNMYLYDPDRKARYPIYEDRNGTHIFSPNDICMIDELEEILEAGIDSLKIDGILKDEAYMIAVTQLYRQAIDWWKKDPDIYEDNKDELLARVEAVQPENRPLDTGFFFKETVY